MNDNDNPQEENDMKKMIPQVNKDGTVTMIEAPDISNVKAGKVDRFRKHSTKK